MQYLTLSELIGQAIVQVRYSYISENEYGLQEFYTYFKLSNGVIIDFPTHKNENFILLNEENKAWLNQCFNEGDNINELGKRRIENQSIEDIYFCNVDSEGVANKTAYLKLSNGCFITEMNFAPMGISADLLIFDEPGFLQRVKDLNENVTSYLETKALN